MVNRKFLKEKTPTLSHSFEESGCAVGPRRQSRLTPALLDRFHAQQMCSSSANVASKALSCPTTPEGKKSRKSWQYQEISQFSPMRSMITKSRSPYELFMYRAEYASPATFSSASSTSDMSVQSTPDKSMTALSPWRSPSPTSHRLCPATPKRQKLLRPQGVNCPGAPRKVRRVLFCIDNDVNPAKRKLDMIPAH